MNYTLEEIRSAKKQLEKELTQFVNDKVREFETRYNITVDDTRIDQRKILLTNGIGQGQWTRTSIRVDVELEKL